MRGSINPPNLEMPDFGAIRRGAAGGIVDHPVFPAAPAGVLGKAALSSAGPAILRLCRRHLPRVDLVVQLKHEETGRL
jgi:hypothetical protein